MDTGKFAAKISQQIFSKKGYDVLIMDLRKLATFADYFVICSGTSERMVKALMFEVKDEVKKEFGLNARLEGEAQAGWMLADYGEVILHIFSPDRREYYSLEELWAEAKTVLRLQ